MPDISQQSIGAQGRRHKLFIIMLTPSWLSGLVAVVASLAIMLATIVALHFPGSSFQTLVDDHHHGSAPAISSGSATVNNNFSSNQLITDIPLFVLWGCIGLLAYTFIISLANSLRNIGAVMSELTFTHINRGRLLLNGLERIVARLAALAAWVSFTELTIHTILPYAIALTQYASGSVGLLNSVADGGLAFVMLAVCLQVHVILFRLLLLRPRAFGQVEYV